MLSTYPEVKRYSRQVIEKINNLVTTKDMENTMYKSNLICLKLIFAASILSAAPAIAAESSNDTANAWRADRNGDGIISVAEKRRAHYLHNRIDLNDDGRTGVREKQYARYLRNHADRNHDGRIGPRERAANQRFMNRTDRRF